MPGSPQGLLIGCTLGVRTGKQDSGRMGSTAGVKVGDEDRTCRRMLKLHLSARYCHVKFQIMSCEVLLSIVFVWLCWVRRRRL